MSDKHEFNKNLAHALYEAANRAFGDTVTAKTWMETPLATLKYRKPLDVAMASNDGQIRVTHKLRVIKAQLNG